MFQRKFSLWLRKNTNALERAVEEFAENPENRSMLEACVVTLEDFQDAISDIAVTMSTSDYDDSEDEPDSSDESATKDSD